MSGIHIHLEATDNPEVVLIRTSEYPNPECKPAIAIPRAELGELLQVLVALDALHKGSTAVPKGD